MALSTLLCLALSVVVVVASPRQRGDPIHQRDQDRARFVELPQSILDNLLSDPRYSEDVRQIIAANTAPETVPIRPQPVEPTRAPAHQYKPSNVESEPKPIQYQNLYRPSPAPSNSHPYRRVPAARPTPPVYPTGSDLLIDAQIGHLLRTTPGGAQLIGVKPHMPGLPRLDDMPETPQQPLIDRLPDNSTLIRPAEDIVDTFSCEGRLYGYYADVDNGCQIFHICLPLKQLYPANFTSEVTYTFSFICPKATVFSQDVVVCTWETEAIPCETSPALYVHNSNYFTKIDEGQDTERWASLHEPVAEPESLNGAGTTAVDRIY